MHPQVEGLPPEKFWNLVHRSLNKEEIKIAIVGTDMVGDSGEHYCLVCFVASSDGFDNSDNIERFFRRYCQLLAKY
jgi:hypothetical protein